MDALRVDAWPSVSHPAFVLGFSGWPDAAEVGSGALAYLVKTLGATRFAALDPEPFFLFGQARPTTLLLDDGQRTLVWPGGEFFSGRDPSGRDLVLFLGGEPNLGWAEYLATLCGVVDRLGGGPIITLGGTYDRVSHRGPARVSGWSPSPELRHALTSMGLRFSSYEGPTGVQSALMDTCTRRGLTAASLWGHAPHYVTGIANPKVAHGLLAVVSALLGLTLDLAPLASAGQEMEAQINLALSGRRDLEEYVGQLETEPTEAWEHLLPRESRGGEPPRSHESIIDDLETFLHALEEDGDEDEGDEP